MNFALWFWAWPEVQKQFPSWFQKKEENVRRFRAAPMVAVEKVKRGPITQRKEISGTLKAIDTVTLNADATGRIRDIFFKQGTFVKKGKLLVQIDDRKEQAEVNEAHARVKQFQAAYNRAKILVEKKYGTAAALEKAQGELESAKAALEKAKVHLSFTQIRAPFEGDIGFKNISIGAYVSPNQEIATLMRINPIEVEFSVPESYVKDLSVGQDIDVTVEGYDSLPLDAKISAIEPYADPISHSIKIKAQLPNANNDLRPGAYARVMLTLSNDKNAIIVPEAALVREGDQDYVFLIVRGLAYRQAVVKGSEEEGNVQIINGLNEGQTIVVDGASLLMNGSPVRIKGQDDVKKEEKSSDKDKK